MGWGIYLTNTEYHALVDFSLRQAERYLLRGKKDLAERRVYQAQQYLATIRQRMEISAKGE